MSCLDDVEIKVVTLIAKGKTDIQISKELFFSPRKVGNLIRTIKNKLNTDSRVIIGIIAYNHFLKNEDGDTEN